MVNEALHDYGGEIIKTLSYIHHQHDWDWLFIGITSTHSALIPAKKRNEV